MFTRAQTFGAFICIEFIHLEHSYIIAFIHLEHSYLKEFRHLEHSYVQNLYIWSILILLRLYICSIHINRVQTFGAFIQYFIEFIHLEHSYLLEFRYLEDIISFYFSLKHMFAVIIFSWRNKARIPMFPVHVGHRFQLRGVNQKKNQIQNL